MKNVVYVPLDERPCNYQYPKSLASMTDIEMIIPDREMLGSMKVPANVPNLLDWISQEVQAASHLIVSIDMLVYGGIVPSRLHQLSAEECLTRLSTLRKIKEQNPDLRIFAYDLIMRVPAYNSSEEEPDYYEEFGERIFRLGWLYDKKDQNLLSSEDQIELARLEKEIPVTIQEDYLGRRQKNFSVTQEVLQLVDHDIIDYLIIPLDDNSPFGFTAKEQRQLMYTVDRLNLMDKINIYPGADEIACTLFSRVFCEIYQYTPEIFIRYSSTNGPFIIPRYEDRILSESIKSHISSAGGMIVYDEKDNNVILMVHAPARGQQEMAESSFTLEGRHRTYFSEVNIREFVQAMSHYLSKGKNVALADVAVSNGADHSLMQLLGKKGLLGELLAYAGWNTNGNTMGTVIAHAIIASYYTQSHIERTADHEEKSREFYYSRLVEDWGYQTLVRKHISETVLPSMGLTPRFLGNHLNAVTKEVEDQLNEFIQTNLAVINEHKIQLNSVHLPWKRMFEVGFELSLGGD